MTYKEVMQELEKLGNEQTKKTLTKHGAREPFFGVRVGDMKKLVKANKKDHELCLKLYDSGNSDAMYLAGLIADPPKFTKDILNDWVKKAYWSMISEYTVPDVTSQNEFGLELALEWIDVKNEEIASAGWATLSRIVGPKVKTEIPADIIKSLLSRIEKDLKDSPNRVRYTMNGFLISAGSYKDEVTNTALEVAGKIGKVKVDMGGTACKVPDAASYIAKTRKRLKK